MATPDSPLGGVREQDSKPDSNSISDPDSISKSMAKSISKDYLAGFFDGEGCFSAQSSRGWMANFYITISTTKKIEAEIFKERYGGSLSENNTTNPDHSVFWTIRISGMDALETAKELQPYLIGKREQCDVFIEALENKRRYNDKRGRGEGYSEEVKREMKEYAKEVRSYNG